MHRTDWLEKTPWACLHSSGPSRDSQQCRAHVVDGDGSPTARRWTKFRRRQYRKHSSGVQIHALVHITNCSYKYDWAVCPLSTEHVEKIAPVSAAGRMWRGGNRVRKLLAGM